MWRLGLQEDHSKTSSQKSSERKRKQHLSSNSSKTAKELQPIDSRNEVRSPSITFPEQYSGKHASKMKSSEGHHHESRERPGSRKDGRAFSPLSPMVSPVSPKMMVMRMQRPPSITMERRPAIHDPPNPYSRKTNTSSESFWERRSRHALNFDKIKEIQDRVSKV